MGGRALGAGGGREGARGPRLEPAEPPEIPGFLAAIPARGRDFIVFGDERGRWARALLALGAASVEAWDPGLSGPAPFHHPSLRWRAVSAARAEPGDVLFRDAVCLGPPEEAELAGRVVRAAEHALLAAPAQRAAELAEEGFRQVGSLAGPGSWLVFAKGLREPERALPATAIEPAP